MCRAYFRCAKAKETGCQAKRFVDLIEGANTENSSMVTFVHEHNHNREPVLMPAAESSELAGDSALPLPLEPQPQEASVTLEPSLQQKSAVTQDPLLQQQPSLKQEPSLQQMPSTTLYPSLPQQPSLKEEPSLQQKPPYQGPVPLGTAYISQGEPPPSLIRTRGQLEANESQLAAQHCQLSAHQPQEPLSQSASQQIHGNTSRPTVCEPPGLPSQVSNCQSQAHMPQPSIDAGLRTTDATWACASVGGSWRGGIKEEVPLVSLHQWRQAAESEDLQLFAETGVPGMPSVHSTEDRDLQNHG